MAGFLKAVCAVNQRVVPPTFNLVTPNLVFSEGGDAECLYPVMEGQVKPEGEQMRAGASAACVLADSAPRPRVFFPLSLSLCM